MGETFLFRSKIYDLNFLRFFSLSFWYDSTINLDVSCARCVGGKLRFFGKSFPIQCHRFRSNVDNDSCVWVPATDELGFWGDWEKTILIGRKWSNAIDGSLQTHLLFFQRFFVFHYEYSVDFFPRLLSFFLRIFLMAFEVLMSSVCGTPFTGFFIRLFLPFNSNGIDYDKGWI